MEKLFYAFCMTIIVECTLRLKEEFMFIDNRQLCDTNGVLSSSLLACSARCSQLGEECCVFNFDSHTGRCAWSSDCSEVGDSISGRTFRRKSMSGAKRDCSDVPVVYGNGIYNITPINNGDKEIEVYCDMETDGGGWTVIQRRVNAATDFYRNWTDYKNGFGNLGENFWLGNDHIHAIVQQKPFKVRFDLEDKNGTTAYAEYSTFFVGNESTGYTLTIDGYTGNAGDAMMEGIQPRYHNLTGMLFSTPDRDNDQHPSYHCARELTKCGWWLNYCTTANMNGVYNSTNTAEFPPDPIYWWNWRGHEAMRRVEMKIKS